MRKNWLGTAQSEKAKELHHDIVSHLFELALKISIVEKF